MKKISVLFVTVALVLTLLFNFTACDMSWDPGAGSITQSSSSSADELTEAKAEYAVSLNAVMGVNLSQTKDENGKVTQDEYTRSSVAAMNAALESIKGFDLEGKTAEEINAANQQIKDALALLETADQAIDKRLDKAIDQLDLGLTYFKYVGDNSVQITKEEYEELLANEGKANIAIESTSGVERIDYSEETNAATFVLTEESMNMLLTTFMQTGVLNMFQENFLDLTSVEFLVSVYETPDATEKTEKLLKMPVNKGDASGGMLLAAGLLAVCAGLEQNLYNAIKDETSSEFDSILKSMIDKTYSVIKGTSCIATITFDNDEYIKTSTFSIAFTDPTANN